MLESVLNLCEVHDLSFLFTLDCRVLSCYVTETRRTGVFYHKKYGQKLFRTNLYPFCFIRQKYLKRLTIFQYFHLMQSVECFNEIIFMKPLSHFNIIRKLFKF